MKVVNWIGDNIYWILAVAFLVISCVCFFAIGDMLVALVAYIGFFGGLILHEIEKLGQKIEYKS